MTMTTIGEIISYERKISIVTVCYRRWHHLRSTIRSWLASDYPSFEVVVVANGDDPDVEYVTRYSDFRGQVLLLDNSPYYRSSYMRNVGALAARGEYLAFVDADVWLHPTWLSSCMHQLQKDSDIVINDGIVRGRDCGGATGTMAIAKWLFERVHGYNENLDYSWGYEDTDLLIRSQRAGGRVGSYSPELLNHVQHGDSERSKYFCKKHDPRRSAVFLQHIRECEKDAAIHPFEANRLQRLNFSPDSIRCVSV